MKIINNDGDLRHKGTNLENGLILSLLSRFAQNFDDKSRMIENFLQRKEKKKKSCSLLFWRVIKFIHSEVINMNNIRIVLRTLLFFSLQKQKTNFSLFFLIFILMMMKGSFFIRKIFTCMMIDNNDNDFRLFVLFCFV